MMVALKRRIKPIIAFAILFSTAIWLVFTIACYGHISPVNMPGGYFASNKNRVIICETEDGTLTTNRKNARCHRHSNSFIATALSENAINRTGWAFLDVKTAAGKSDEYQAYAAGLAEAQVTRQLISWHLTNTIEGYCKGVKKYCERLQTFLTKNIDFMKRRIKRYPRDPYWYQVKLVLYQLSGMHDGYFNHISRPHMDIQPMSKIMLLQLFGDLFDLERTLKRPIRRQKRVFGSGSCSAFIKVLPETADLYFAHDTWSLYQTMLRVLKRYTLGYLRNGANHAIAGKQVAFSGYPGVLPSIDDYYLTSAGLAITETTIENNNKELLRWTTPQTVLTWVRSQVATRLAHGAKEWMEIFRKHNSGTYNSQWMVVDYKKFTPGRPLPRSGLLYVLEQLPGMIEMRDMTLFLARHHYWPSFNMPYFANIYNTSGQLNNVKAYGDWFTYAKNPRSQIFKRDWRNVTDMKSLQKLMRYNDYRNDPLSRCEKCTPPYSANNAISARNDLNPKNGSYPFAILGHLSLGGIDMKATNYELFRKLHFVAIGGPTFDNLPPFRWSIQDFANSTPHVGHPDLSCFQPITTEWTNV